MSDLIRVRSYVEGEWKDGEGQGSVLLDPTTGEAIARASTRGIDMGTALRHARSVGGVSLRKLGFGERGKILGGLARVIGENRDELLELSRRNGGNTRDDGKFDVLGGSGALAFYAGLSRSLGEETVLTDGEPFPIGKETPLSGRHVWVSRRGAAIFINAYNFPAWGMCEKLACAFLAGMPVVVKPATQTGLLAFRLAELFVDSGLLPDGSFSFLAGPSGDLLEHVEAQDVIAFTGSAATAATIRSHPRILERGVRVNVEADSLNSAVVGPDVEPGSETWDLFIGETIREMTQKAGQKCTATRRILVPTERVDEAVEHLSSALARVEVGDPASADMGPLTSATQLADVRRGVGALAAEAEIVFGDPQGGRDDGEGGFFMPPVLLRARSDEGLEAIHDWEVFGPVSTVIPFDGRAERAGELVARGDGSLVSTVYSDDAEFVAACVREIAPHCGRVNLGSADVAAESWGPGAVLPGLIHGGPGRAGGGEELGGVRGIQAYMQRVALEGSSRLIDAAFPGGG